MVSTPADPEGLSAQELDRLHAYSFDAAAFATLRADLAAGRFPPERNQVNESISPPRPGDILPWPTPGTAEARACQQEGEAALSAGHVAVAILNGGMATRFGGRVKGVVEVVGGHSFLALKLRDVNRVSAKAPVFLMNSFATDHDTRAHLDGHDHFGLADRIHFVTQGISLRLTPKGDLFRDAQGQVSFYAPGHGDLLAALARSEAFGRFVDGGGKYITISNVDNLAATLSPMVIGAHIRGRRSLTVEVAPRQKGDAGGAPVRRGDKLEVLEGFRFPKGFDADSLPVFNTNTFVLGVEAVRADYPLTWFRADKEVGGAKVVQFERLVGEVTSFAPATYLQVPRQGPAARFLPVKTPDDVLRVQPLVQQLFAL
ncbi:MAG TPA: UTP--glucose-1-phosphate uridylyltransferase [Myxococcota bacterium]|nr:UTP--glucose-1-phosphate uridylyltransferase [Myxococcota bacterium]